MNSCKGGRRHAKIQVGQTGSFGMRNHCCGKRLCVEIAALEKALAALLEPPVIRGLTESLTNLDPTERRTIVAKLRRARLLARIRST
jgi:hypothetical protein